MARKAETLHGRVRPLQGIEGDQAEWRIWSEQLATREARTHTAMEVR